VELVEEITMKYNDHHWPLLTELKKYAESNTDPSTALEFRPVKIKYNEKRGKGIDAIWKRGNFNYIIEAKPELNFEAIGQVNVYEFLYEKIHPTEKIKKGIVCKEPIDTIDRDLLSYCSEKDITIFTLTKNGIYEHTPNAI
jgi:hypothetical protein